MSNGQLTGESATALTPAVTGTNTCPPKTGASGPSDGVGVLGDCKTGIGVQGKSDFSDGVQGISEVGNGVSGQSALGGNGVSGTNNGPPTDAGNGVFGSSANGNGVQGTAAGGNGSGVSGANTSAGHGVYGTSVSGNGVHGESANGQGVYGIGHSNQAGVSGYNDAPFGKAAAGVHGESAQWRGVEGFSHSSGAGVHAFNNSSANAAGQGVWAESNNGDALYAISHSANHAGVSATNDTGRVATVPSAPALFAVSQNTGVHSRGNPAGYFEGDVQVTGDVILLNSPTSGDVAEDFDIEDDPVNAEPGAVLVIGENGQLRACSEPYDSRLAGVVSGAGELKPAVILQRIQAKELRLPIALIGKVYCKVDATFGAIVAGDLLTTSSVSGHAMKVSDKSRALGAIIGKALASIEDGRGTIPIMVGLQ